MTVTLVFVFTSRAIKDFLSGLLIGDLDYENPHVRTFLRQVLEDLRMFQLESIPTQTLLFSLMFVWEVIPAVLVIGLFWRIPNTAKKGNTNTTQAPHHPYYNSISINAPVQKQR